MPQLSDTMTEGTIVKWLKKEGDKIKAGEVVAEVETDKATMEMESFESGTLASIVVAEGDKAAVGSAIALVAGAGEKVEDVKKGASGAAGGSAAKAQAAGSTQPSGGGTTVANRPAGETARATKPAGVGRTSADLSSPHESNEKAEDGEAEAPNHDPHTGKARQDLEKHHAEAHKIKVHHDSNGEAEANSRVKASPLARRVAADMKVDLAQVEGSGPGGRVVQADVLAYAESPDDASAANADTATVDAGASGPQAASPVAARPADAPAGGKKPSLPNRVPSGQTEKIQLTKMRQAIAAQLQRSKQNIPHFYETVDIDMTAANALRQKLLAAYEKKEGLRISIGDIIAKAVAASLKLVPQLNSTFDEKTSTVTRHGDVNLGMAVALPDGLIVPVLRGIDQMGIKEIRQRSAELVDRARQQKLKRDEMSGATFTVSNLGSMGIREFSAIVNPPEVGILAIGAGEDRAVVRGGQIVVRNLMSVTLSCDHRVIDGAVAAAFLGTLKQMLEEPAMMLV